MKLLPIEREARAIRKRLNRLLHTATCMDCGQTLSKPYCLTLLRCRRCSGLARSKRTSQALALRSQNPQLRATEIASRTGVSRERVRQILKKAGLPTKFVSDPGLYCCNSCGKRLAYRINKFGLCLACLKASRHALVYKTFICEICGLPFERRMAEVRSAKKYGRRIRWCARACQGKAFGKSARRGRREQPQPVAASKEG